MTVTWRRGGAAAAAMAVLAVAGCLGAGAGGDPGTGLVDPDDMVPPGFGTLLQDEITVSMRRGPVQVKVTPLAEWVIRLAAPDTYERLSSLARAHGPPLQREADVQDPSLFLVSFFSEATEADFRPEDLHLTHRGIRHRPLAIRGFTTGWGAQRLRPRETQMAVYAFPPDIDLDQALEVVYGTVRSTAWDAILQRLQVERSRARARAGS